MDLNPNVSVIAKLPGDRRVWSIAVGRNGIFFSMSHSIFRCVDTQIEFLCGSGVAPVNGIAGYKDGRGADARFNYPCSIAVCPDGVSLVVADKNNHRIRTVSETGTVGTLAGNGPTSSYGRPELPTFHYPYDLIVRKDGTVFFCDTWSFKMISTDGTVRTFLRFDDPHQYSGLASSVDGGFISRQTVRDGNSCDYVHINNIDPSNISKLGLSVGRRMVMIATDTANNILMRLNGISCLQRINVLTKIVTVVMSPVADVMMAIDLCGNLVMVQPDSNRKCSLVRVGSTGLGPGYAAWDLPVWTPTKKCASQGFKWTRPAVLTILLLALRATHGGGDGGWLRGVAVLPTSVWFNIIGMMPFHAIGRH